LRLANRLERNVNERPKIARRISLDLAREWRKVAKRPHATGDRKSGSLRLEDALSREIVELLRPHANVLTRDTTRLKELFGIRFEADILIESKDSAREPVSVISLKTTLATGELKQAIGEAYVLGKLAGQHRRKLRYYLVVTHRAYDRAKAVNVAIDISKRYLHGVYALTQPPYVDKLFDKLRRMYS